MLKTSACTIVSNNYLAFARVLATSFKEHNPGGEVYTLIVDRPDSRIDYDAEPFEAVFAEDLGIADFRNMAFRYSILELNTAVKPFWLSYLHRTYGLSQVCYFDPDILIMDSLSRLYAKLAESEILLTPHITDTIDDPHHPSEHDILRAGIYNLGFLGVSFNPCTVKFLDWWGKRLHESGESDIEGGLFVDQKWMDFAPAFVPGAAVLDDPGLNVAYWNLMHRRPHLEEGRWRVGDVPLRFFHFSGFDPRNPDDVSKHQNRYTLSDLSDLEPLFRHYARLLISQSSDELRSLEYAYAVFDNGVRVPDFCRKTLGMLDWGARWSDPFRTGHGSYYEWLRAPAPNYPGLPRLALSLWDCDPLSRARFPFDQPDDAQQFGHWLVTEGARLHKIDEAFLGDWKAVLSSSAPLAPEGQESPASAATESDLNSILRSSKPGAELNLWISRLGVAADLWLNSDVSLRRSGPLLSRLAFAIYRSRQDLRELYPQPMGISRKELARWFVTHGAIEYDLPDAAVAPVARSFPLREQIWIRLWWFAKKRVVRFDGGIPQEGLPNEIPDAPSFPGSRVSPSAPPGMHVIGYLEAPTGKGEEGRGTLAALEAAGISHRAWTVSGLSQEFAEDDSRILLSDDKAAFPVALYHINADMMRAVRRRLPPLLKSAPLHIGYWDWELSHFPLEFGDRYEGLAEVWAPSRFCCQTFASLSSIPVRWVPPCVIPAVTEPLPRSELDVPEDAFLFFNSFDIRSIPERKNPEGLVRAFQLLSQNNDHSAHLLLKVNHAEDQPKHVDRLREMAEGLPVTFLTEQTTRKGMNALMAACDCYISLHRAEGLGLPLIEAMYLGIPVIATGYSGNVDFLDESTGWPVEYRLCRLHQDTGPYPRGSVWADPDPRDAARQMSSVLSQPDERRKRAQEARRKVFDTYSPQAAGRRFSRHLERLMSSLAVEEPEPL
ncbi:MAG TPA: glycosyltransferase family 4 protein [Acidobacteriota bacterium]|nr:glycosyltransferase family 4 protein [Acidobacteriota bacterium]